jgi:hypothetical protein
LPAVKACRMCTMCLHQACKMTPLWMSFRLRQSSGFQGFLQRVCTVCLHHAHKPQPSMCQQALHKFWCPATQTYRMCIVCLHQGSCKGHAGSTAVCVCIAIRTQVHIRHSHLPAAACTAQRDTAQQRTWQQSIRQHVSDRIMTVRKDHTTGAFLWHGHLPAAGCVAQDSTASGSRAGQQDAVQCVTASVVAAQRVQAEDYSWMHF